MGAWGPVTNLTARAPASWLGTLWGRHEGAREGRLLPGCGAFGVGRSPAPDRLSFVACGRGPLPIDRGCGGCGHGDPPPTPQRALLRAGFARCRGGTRAPGRGASCLDVGHPGSGALWPPTTRPLRHAAGAHYPLTVGAGGAGMGTRHQPHSARSCELALRAVGAARGHPGGAPLAWQWGVQRQALSNPRPPVLWGMRPGSLPTGCGCGVRAWGHGCPWHLLPCRGSSCVVRASWVCGTRWPLWLGTCPCAVVVAGGVPLWPASWPRVGAPHLVWSGRSLCSGRLSCRRGAFPHPGGCRPRLYWVAARGTWRLAENQALCACPSPLPMQGRWACSASYPFGAPLWGCPWRVPPASVLGCMRCGGVACVDPVTDAFGFPYRPSFDWVLGRCTRAVSRGRRHLPFRVGGHHARVPRVCACACFPGRVGRAGLPGAFRCASPFPVAVRGALFVWSVPYGLGSPCLWFSCFLLLLRPRCLRPFVFTGPGRLGPWRLVPPPPSLVGFFFPFSLLRPPCLQRSVFSGPGCLGPWRLVPHAPPLGFIFPLLRAPLVSDVPCFPSLGASGLGALCPPPPLLFFFPVLWCARCAVLRLCVLGSGACSCVLLWALCCAGGLFALALRCLVPPACASPFCAVACCVARAR